MQPVARIIRVLLLGAVLVLTGIPAAVVGVIRLENSPLEDVAVTQTSSLMPAVSGRRRLGSDRQRACVADCPTLVIALPSLKLRPFCGHMMGGHRLANGLCGPLII